VTQGEEWFLRRADSIELTPEENSQSALALVRFIHAYPHP